MALIQLVVFFVVAYLYTRWKPETTQPPTLEGRPFILPYIDENPDYCGGFQYSLCGCCQNPLLCLVGWCCEDCRWAHTSHLAGVWNYWAAVSIMGLLVILSELTYGFTLWLALGAAIKVRQDLRRKMGFRNVGGMTLVTDCC